MKYFAKLGFDFEKKTAWRIFQSASFLQVADFVIS